MSDFNEVLAAAESIYDHPTSKPPAPAENKPEPKDALAVALYVPKALPEVKGIPEAVVALREASKGIYDPAQPFAEAISIDKEDGVAEPKPEQAAFVNELRLMAADTGISPAEMQEVATLARIALATPVTEEQLREWRAEAEKQNLDRNNQDILAARRDIELARKLVQRDPRVRAILNHTGLGNHPRVVSLMVEAARNERAAGRL